MKRQDAVVDSTVRGDHFRVETPAFVCPKCGHVAVEGEDLPELMRRTADAYRKAHGLLTSGELRDRRSRLRMSQREFAAYLGEVGEASIKRWELGGIQDVAMNELIVLKTDPAAAERNVAELAFRLTAGKISQTGYGQLDTESGRRIFRTEPESPDRERDRVGTGKESAYLA